ncbi:MAG: DUF427 domain-containing protein [Rhodospirillales bacterium]|jgi:uncharacterized protein (DUF427 family)|nr:DUF427 domain-containing protein [Rhodospirillales bacterium]
MVRQPAYSPAYRKEAVRDYPRPPRCEPVRLRLRVVLAGVAIADTRRGIRVLETNHPPVYYFPADDVLTGHLSAATGTSFCEWKGIAHYFDVEVAGRRAGRAAWSYPSPAPGFAAIAGHFAFYAGPMDACFVGEEAVRPQPGTFYGGWITDHLIGPFKGGPGTAGW